ncbi:uncharacterized protein MONBRDRAFT_22827, partial [Monosiga brevicollis MX1]
MEGGDQDWLMLEEEQVPALREAQRLATDRICTRPACGQPLPLLARRRRRCQACQAEFCSRCCTAYGGGTSFLCLDCCAAQPHLHQEPGVQRNKSTEFLARRRVFRNHTHSDLRLQAVRLARGLPKPSLASSLSHTLGLATPATSRWSRCNVLPQAATAPACHACNAPFQALLRPRQFCRLCGRALCAKCIFNTIQVYRQNLGDSDAKVQVYHPDLEQPAQSVILPGCDACLTALEDACGLDRRLDLAARQRQKSHSSPTPSQAGVQSSMSGSAARDQGPGGLEPNSASEPFHRVCQLYNKRLFQLARQLRQDFARYHILVCSISGQDVQVAATPVLSASLHALLLNAEADLAQVGSRDRVNLVAKSQVDLTEGFEALQKCTLQLTGLLKRQGPDMRPVEQRVTRNLINAHARLYQERIGAFRAARAQLAEVLPDHVLTVIQATNDERALRFAVTQLRQVGIELMAFDRLQSLAADTASCLSVLEDDWHRSLTSINQNSSESMPALEFDAESAAVQQLVQDLFRSQPLLLPCLKVPHAPTRQQQ